MHDRTGCKTTHTLRMLLGGRNLTPSINGIVNNQARLVGTTSTGTIREIWEARHPLMDKIGLKKSEQV